MLMELTHRDRRTILAIVGGTERYHKVLKSRQPVFQQRFELIASPVRANIVITSPHAITAQFHSLVFEVCPYE